MGDVGKGGERFSSRWVGLLSLAGVAIGLGNVWRFPYMMGKSGGSAFLAVYLVFVALLAVPALAGEWALGRHSQAGTVGAFREALGRRAGGVVALLLVLSITVATSYYIVVVAQVAFTAGFALYPGFSGGTQASYQAWSGNPVFGALASVATLAAALWVLSRGLKGGIEWVSKWFVPVFGLSALSLAGLSLSQDGAMGHLAAFMQPDFGSMGTKDVFAALGQACYSVGIGGTFMLTYGRFMRPQTPLISTALSTSLLDTGAALLATLILVPTILIYGLDLESGPGLIFKVFPALLEQLPGGRVLGPVFLGALWLMAFLSAIAGLEVSSTGFRELFPSWGRRRRWTLMAGFQVLVIVACCWDPGLIGTLDMVFGSGMQIFGCGLAIFSLTWLLDSKLVVRELGGGRLAGALHGWLRWVVPPVLFVILYATLWELISG